MVGSGTFGECGHDDGLELIKLTLLEGFFLSSSLNYVINFLPFSLLLCNPSVVTFSFNHPLVLFSF